MQSVKGYSLDILQFYPARRDFEETLFRLIDNLIAFNYISTSTYVLIAV